MSIEVFFLPLSSGQRFCIYHPAHCRYPKGLIVYVHPFAEEMNNARRVAALQSRAFASAGYAVLQMDLLGCGDSSGDFGDARWQDWVIDVVHACAWLRARACALGADGENVPLWLWGVRAGSLLCCDAAGHIGGSCHFLFWQPYVSGKLALQQFLRLRLAANMLDARTTHGLHSLRNVLDKGDAVEVAGYTLSAELARGMEKVMLTPPVGDQHVRTLRWLDVSSVEPTRSNPLSDQALAAWQQAHHQVERLTVPGPAFWQSGEGGDVPALRAATSALFATAGSA